MSPTEPEALIGAPTEPEASAEELGAGIGGMGEARIGSPSEPEARIVAPSEPEARIVAPSEPETLIGAPTEPEDSVVTPVMPTEPEATEVTLVAPSEPETRIVAPSEPEAEAVTPAAPTEPEGALTFTSEGPEHAKETETRDQESGGGVEIPKGRGGASILFSALLALLMLCSLGVREGISSPSALPPTADIVPGASRLFRVTKDGGERLGSHGGKALPSPGAQGSGGTIHERKARHPRADASVHASAGM